MAEEKAKATEASKKTTDKVEEVEAKVREEAPTTSAPASSSSSADLMAIGALIFGFLNLCSWCFPICGVPMSLLGLLLGYLGMKSEKYSTMAKIGLVLSGLGLAASLLNALAGVAFSFADWNSSYDLSY